MLAMSMPATQLCPLAHGLPAQEELVRTRNSRGACGVIQRHGGEGGRRQKEAVALALADDTTRSAS